jgi:hypothetical protein
MKIKIPTLQDCGSKKVNLAPISAALAAVNGTAVGHTYDVSDIVRLAEEAETFAVTLFTNKKQVVGARYRAESGDKVPSAYKFSRISTLVTLERFSTGWFLIEVSRGTIWGSGGSQQLILDAAQDFLATAKARSRYTVRPSSIT